MLMKTRHDEALTAKLADLVVDLQRRRYGELSERLDLGFLSTIRAFGAELEKHLKYEEDVLFPVLEQAVPASAGRLEFMREKHEILRLDLRDAADRLAAGDVPGAHEMARSLLAAILDHAREEESLVLGIIRSLDGAAAEDFRRRLAS